jgi:hypothetical protein
MGVWIRPDGKWKPIPDHFNYIREHPVEFGFKKKEAAAWTLANHGKVIETALQRGFVRVRGTRPNLSFEFWTLDQGTIANIRDFLIGEKIDRDEMILFEEGSSSRQPPYEPASWILDGGADKVARNPRRRR